MNNANHHSQHIFEYRNDEDESHSVKRPMLHHGFGDDKGMCYLTPFTSRPRWEAHACLGGQLVCGCEGCSEQSKTDEACQRHQRSCQHPVPDIEADTGIAAQDDGDGRCVDSCIDDLADVQMPDIDAEGTEEDDTCLDAGMTKFRKLINDMAAFCL